MSWLRCWCVAAVLLIPSARLLADGPAAETPAADSAGAGGLDKFSGDPNDFNALREYFGAQFGKITASTSADPDLAEKQLNELSAMAKELQVDNDMSKQILQQVESAVAYFRQRIELARVKVEDLKKKLDESPDALAVQQYVQKVAQSLMELAGTDAAAAEKQLAEAREYLTAIGDKTEDAAVKQAIEQSGRIFGRVERSIESEKRLAELIGNDAVPLDVPTWVNGGPLTADDLKGKVVMLDFWAVWCGPCIATFPNLRDWYAQYHEQGLEIVGITGYYNFKWDDAAGKAASAPRGETVSPEDERAMLVKFAEQHKLTHPFAISEDGALAKHYAVTGIPHVVLIDRAGKIRLIKVGSGPANTKEIGETIEQLIAE